MYARVHFMLDDASLCAPELVILIFQMVTRERKMEQRPTCSELTGTGPLSYFITSLASLLFLAVRLCFLTPQHGSQAEAE